MSLISFVDEKKNPFSIVLMSMACLLFQTTMAIKAKLCWGVYNKSKHAQKIHVLACMFAHTYVQITCAFSLFAYF